MSKSDPSYYFVSYAVHFYEVGAPPLVSNDIVICDKVLPIRQFEKLTRNRYSARSVGVIGFQRIDEEFAKQASSDGYRELVKLTRPNFKLHQN